MPEKQCQILLFLDCNVRISSSTDQANAFEVGSAGVNEPQQETVLPGKPVSKLCPRLIEQSDPNRCHDTRNLQQGLAIL